jgi:hypothetical protein
MESKLHISLAQGHGIHISILKGRKRIPREDWSKARPKPNRENITFCSSISRICGIWWPDVSDKEFGQP